MTTTTTTTKRHVLSCGYELSVLRFSHVRQNRSSPTKRFDPNTLSGQAQSGAFSASRWDHGYIQTVQVGVPWDQQTPLFVHGIQLHGENIGRRVGMVLKPFFLERCMARGHQSKKYMMA